MIAAAAPWLAVAVAATAAEAGAPSGPPAAEPLEVRLRLERREVRLGEPFELAVEVRHRPAERYGWSEPGPGEPFRVLASGCARVEAGAEATTTCTLRLALFDLGPQDLPELRLEAGTPAGARALRVPGPTVTGAGLLDPAAPTDSLALKDLAPPAPLHVLDARLALGLPALLVAAVAGALGWRAWRRRARARWAEPPPPLPPHERFARQLDALAEARLGERGRAPEAIARLSEHVREYLGAITGHPALDLTTAELLERLAFQPDPRIDPGPLRAQLEAADLVKFARAPATAGDAEAALAWARSLLARTRPPPATEAAP